MSQSGVISVSSGGGGGAQTFTTDSGVATVAAGNINVLGGAGITVSGAGDTVTITSSSLATKWNSIAVNTALLVNNGYICNAPGGALQLTLPLASAVGDEIEIILNGATSWKIIQGAGQQCFIGSLGTTVGAAGYLESTAQGDAIKLLCVTANLTWRSLSAAGSITVA